MLASPLHLDAAGNPEAREPRVIASLVPLDQELSETEPLTVVPISGVAATPQYLLLDGTTRSILFVRSEDTQAEVLVWRPNPYERSVVDGVNVPFEVFRIRTQIGEQGGRIEKGFTVPLRDRHTRRQRYEELSEDVVYAPGDLDRSVVAPNQIRLVLETYRDTLPTELFPSRTEIPKTLIFAKDDHHAEEIVHIAREVFGKGNEFAKKITYAADDPERLIAEFRNSYHPRIAVTVDMIATGTDIKAVEVLIFLRDVRSSLYFEQMKGRGVRTINDADLKMVSPTLG